MENIPRSTQCVQQHLLPASEFFTQEELSAQAERVVYLATGPEPEVVSEAEWARSDAILVAMESERAQAERASGECTRCTMHCADLIGFQGEGLCGECALYLVEVA